MNPNDLYTRRESFYFKPSGVLRGFFIFCCVAGLALFLVGLATGQQQRAWGSFLFNLMFFFSLSLGGVVLGSMQDVIGAEWGRPIKRIHESFSAFLPYAVCAFLLFFLCIRFEVLGAQSVYSWIKNPHLIEHFPGKNVWLQRDFMLLRDAAALFIMLFLAKWHMDQTVRGDFFFLEGKKTEGEAAAKEALRKLRYWSAPVLCVHSLCFSLICFDLTMSLAPTWLSTLWAGWCFSILMHILFASILICMFFLRSTPVGAFIGKAQFHDMGKLLHGFTVFFAYLTFSHVLTYWYTNIPEETSYFLVRLEKPWIYFVVLSPFLSFVFPFFMLIPKISKWNAALTLPVAFVVILAQWLNYFLVVMPEVINPGELFFPWLELGGFVGFLGLFLFSVTLFTKKVPLLNISDPLLAKSLCHKH